MFAANTTPPLRNNALFELPKKLRRRLNSEASQRDQYQVAVLQAQEEISQAYALQYLSRFLKESQWCDMLNHITIVQGAVPKMEELAAYGLLGEKEGTRACRKLFKAVVVWDELGRSLWGKLREEIDDKRRASDGLASPFSEDNVLERKWAAWDSSASSIISRRTSQESFWSSELRGTTSGSIESLEFTKNAPRRHSKDSILSLPPPPRKMSDAQTELIMCECCAINHHVRRSIDSFVVPESDAPPRHELPASFSQNCMTAVRRFGVRRG